MPRGMRRMGREVEVEAAVSPQILLKEEEEVPAAPMAAAAAAKVVTRRMGLHQVPAPEAQA